MYIQWCKAVYAPCLQPSVGGLYEGLIGGGQMKDKHVPVTARVNRDDHSFQT